MALPHIFATKSSPVNANTLDANFAYLVEPGDLMREFGAVWDGLTDDTTPLLNAITAVYNAGGGTVMLPPGLGRVTSVAYNFAAARTVNIIGCGAMATYIQKIGATTTPTLDFSATSLPTEIYSTFGEFSILGNAKTHHGLRATGLARFDTRNLKIRDCDVGFESVGSLIVNHDHPEWDSNNIGFRSRKTGAGLTANLVNVFGGGIRANTSFGLDVGDCGLFHMYGTDIEENGTLANTATGNIKVRDTVDDEFGFSVFLLDGVWMEGSKGSNMVVDAAAGLMLTLRDVMILAPEGGRSLNVGAIKSIVLDNLTAGSAGDTVTTAATTSFIRGGVIHTLNDTAQNYARRGVAYSGGMLNEECVKRLVLQPPGSVTPAANGDMVFELTTNTNLTIRVRGSDGVLRGASLVLG